MSCVGGGGGERQGGQQIQGLLLKDNGLRGENMGQQHNMADLKKAMPD